MHVNECGTAQQFLITLLTKLGFAVSWLKVSPTTRVTFLGYVVDSIQQTVELPDEKIKQLGVLVLDFSRREKLTKREFQVILGHVCFAAKAAHGARTFSRLFIYELTRLNLPHHRLRVSSRLRKEFLWWYATAPFFNGLTSSKFGCSRCLICVSTDASLTGFGAVMGDRWLAGSWDATIAPKSEILLNWMISPIVASSLQKK